MEYYLNEVSSIKLAKGMQEDPTLKPNYADNVTYLGRNYSLYNVYSRQLSGKEKILTFFECLGQAIITFGKALSNQDFQDKWQSIFSNRHVRVVYLKNPIGVSPAPVPPIASAPVPPTAPSSKPPVVSDDKLALNNLLNRTPFEEGLNISALNPAEKKMMGALVQRWLDRKDPVKPKWTVEELSALLGVEVKDLNELFYRIQFFHSPVVRLNSEALTWLFKSIEKELKNETRGSMQGGIKMIWDSRQVVQGQENRCPKGIDKPYWKLKDLSMFLAVRKPALVEFLKLKNVIADAEGNISALDIDMALRTATNGEINGILSSQRTQTKSIRFASN